MSITDELRDFAKRWPCTDYVCKDMIAIADRIDAEHERRCKEQYACGAEDGISVSIDALVIQTHGFIELPKDADGEVWHVEDLAVGEVNPNNPKAVERMLWYGPDSGWQLETDTIIFPCPERVRHYHAPTVEDVLREFANEVYADADSDIRDRDFLCAKYAKRLKLAGDEE